MSQNQDQHTNGNRNRQAPKTAALTKTALGDVEMSGTGETAISAIQAREQAMVQSRIVQAMRMPRVFEKVRERFLADCDRPFFAMAARYSRPQGWVMNEETGKPLIVNGEKVRNFIVGWSIRAVEAAVMAMGNIDCAATTVYEDDDKQIIKCKVWDLERNTSWEAECTVEKTIERKFLKDGQTPLRSRPNSYGDTVYLLPATDDDIRLKKNRIVSMTMRTLGLRAIPGDLLDEALERVEVTRSKQIEAQRAGITADPKAAIRRVLDNFAAIGVRADDVLQYLGGRSIEAATPEMILELRIVGADVKAGNYTWAEALAGSPYREEAEGEKGAPETVAAAKARAKIEQTLADQKRKREGAKDKAAAPQASPSSDPAAERAGAAGTGTTAPTTAASAPQAPQERQPGED